MGDFNSRHSHWDRKSNWRRNKVARWAEKHNWSIRTATGPTFDTNRGKSDIHILLTKSLDVDEPRVQKWIWNGNTEHGQISMKILDENLSLECRACFVSTSARECPKRTEKARKPMQEWSREVISSLESCKSIAELDEIYQKACECWVSNSKRPDSNVGVLPI